jgi:glycosyltransferase 2 family protein
MTAIARLSRRWVLPLFGAIVALTLIFLLYGDLDVGRFVMELKTARPGWILALGATILLEQLIQGWKWRQLLFDLRPVSSWRLTGAFLAGYGANFLVPLGVSPLVRSWIVARLEGLHMATVLTTTVISRFIDGIVFALLAAIVAMAGQIPKIEGNLENGLIIAGGLNFVVFSGALLLLYMTRAKLYRQGSVIGHLTARLARIGRCRFENLGAAIAEGIIWPSQPARQVGVIVASVAMKAVATTHFIWAGLAVGVTLEFFDYLFLMVFAGFALVLARFIRVPGGFVIGSALALRLLEVPDEQAIAMILLNQMIATFLIVGIGLVVLWQSGFNIRSALQGNETPDQST